ncbi:MAG TPA: hypothetical protein PKN93_18710 [Leptospiraceae bacterium]|nr:hypothetical protein [Leptospiraceae bacterium]HNN76689.1 hypothetical protein [Leptospiraceae bacterium]
MSRYTEELKKKAARLQESDAKRRAFWLSVNQWVERQFQKLANIIERQNSKKNDRFLVWWRIRTIDPVVGMFVSSALITLLILTFTIPISEYQTMLLAGSTGDRIALAAGVGGYAIWFWGIYDAIRFKYWRRRCGFPIRGWENLVDDPELEHERWRPCEIHITLAIDSPDIRAGLTALYDVFAIEANRLYYNADSEDDGKKRIPWMSSGTDATGSANSRVLWKIYKLLSEHLGKFHRKTKAIASVSITAGASFNVSHPSSD